MSAWWHSGGHLSCCRQASGLVCLCLILFLVRLLKTLHSREESKDSFCLFSRILPLKGDKAMLVCLCQSIYIKTHVSLCIHFSYTVCWLTSTSSCSNDLPVHRMHTFLLPTCDMLSVGSQSWWVVLSTTPCSHPMCVCVCASIECIRMILHPHYTDLCMGMLVHGIIMHTSYFDLFMIL